MKILYKKSTSNTPDGERLNSFLQISGIREDFWLSPLVLNIVLRVLASAIRQEKETEVIQFGKEVNLPLVKDRVIIWASNPREFAKTLLEKKQKLNKVKYIPNIGSSHSTPRHWPKRNESLTIKNLIHTCSYQFYL